MTLLFVKLSANEKYDNNNVMMLKMQWFMVVLLPGT